MRRPIKIGLIVLGIAFAVTLGFFVDIIGRIQSIVTADETPANPFSPPVAPLFEATDPPMKITVFFPSAGDVLISTQEQTIFKSAELTNRAKQVLARLMEGPTVQGLLPSMPRDTTIEEVFISREGVAFVDFSNAIATNHPGGMRNEQATIYSIVNSLTYNLPEIRQVQILIGGTEKETLAGHCLLLLPLAMDLSITDLAATETGSLAGWRRE